MSATFFITSKFSRNYEKVAEFAGNEKFSQIFEIFSGQKLLKLCFFFVNVKLLNLCFVSLFQKKTGKMTNPDGISRAIQVIKFF